MAANPVIRFRRWLGFDRNPLRRPCDRVEAAVRRLAVLVMLAAVVCGLVLGTRAYGEGIHTEHEQAHARHATEATLLGDARMHTSVNAPATATVPASWQGLDGRSHEGLIQAPVLAVKGQKVTIYTDAQGKVVPHPRDRETTVVAALTVGTGVPLMAIVGTCALLGLTRVLVWRRVRREWADAWTVVEPTWRINGR
ncbi:Rv1733c family protein [Herbidospora cretacea]|uniref:Rv1733c family protein n=1 Tax=Herbidospora cretacea TaxID=28444 RepID=UPI000AE97A4F|nr:hypothetical protein [Herbidospora cretacea]